VREHGEELILAAIGLLQRPLQPALLGDFLRGAHHIVVAGREQRDDEVATRELTVVTNGFARLDHVAQLREDGRDSFRHQLAESPPYDLFARPAHQRRGVAVDVRVEPIPDRT
jgi:hypothetical protein